MLTATQKQTIKADILATPQLNAFPNNGDGAAEIAAIYNANASPDYWVWRAFVSDQEVYSATSVDNTTWNWTSYIGRSQGERDAWRQMVNMAGGYNPSLTSVRTGLADIFSGQTGSGQRTHLLAISRRKASRGEKLFAVATVGGSGARGSAANPDTLTLDTQATPVTYQDIEEARIP